MSERADAQSPDLLAIRETLHRYCRGVDRHDLDLIKSAFHPDAETDHGADFRGNAWRIWAELFERPDTTIASQHHLTNHHVQFVRLAAYAETYFLAYFIRSAGEGVQLKTIGGRYIDKLERRDGAWRIAKRVSVIDWEKTEPYLLDPHDQKRVRGRRDRLDVSYVR